METTTNRGAATYASRRQLFQTRHRSVFPVDTDDLYIVYSYGYHWPIYVYDKATGQWFGNESKYSVTTTRHLSDVKPAPHHEITWLTVEQVVDLVDSGGFTKFAAAKMRRKA